MTMSTPAPFQVTVSDLYNYLFMPKAPIHSTSRSRRSTNTSTVSSSWSLSTPSVTTSASASSSDAGQGNKIWPAKRKAEATIRLTLGGQGGAEMRVVTAGKGDKDARGALRAFTDGGTLKKKCSDRSPLPSSWDPLPPVPSLPEILPPPLPHLQSTPLLAHSPTSSAASSRGPTTPVLAVTPATPSLLRTLACSSSSSSTTTDPTTPMTLPPAHLSLSPKLKSKTRRPSKPHPQAMDPFLAGLETRARLLPASACGVCGARGRGFPSCPRCGIAWCTRECRMKSGGGKKHACPLRSPSLDRTAGVAG